MKLYHGSTVNIDTILLAKSKPNKDFGKAFYLSAERAQAVELAESRVAYPELTLIDLASSVLFKYY